MIFAGPWQPESFFFRGPEWREDQLISQVGCYSSPQTLHQDMR
jgi:hypothetical protein